jgi:Na+/phosphate symporter
MAAESRTVSSSDDELVGCVVVVVGVETVGVVFVGDLVPPLKLLHGVVVVVVVVVGATVVVVLAAFALAIADCAPGGSVPGIPAPVRYTP